MVWPIIVGCNNETQKLSSTPDGFTDPPEQILCINCGNKTRAVYRRDDFYFSICFLNFCRLEKGVPYLSCNTCESSFGQFGTHVCHKCSTAVPSQFFYCPNCGENENR